MPSTTTPIVSTRLILVNARRRPQDEVFPGASLLTGVADPDSLAHSENESVHLGELEKCCVNEAILLGELAGPVRALR